MKKQLIAKLLVLGMVLAMLPISALAADTYVKNEEDGTYTIQGDTTGTIYDWDAEKGEYVARPDTSVPDDDFYYEPVVTPTEATTAPTEAPTEATTEAAPVVVETVEVKTEVNEEGKTVVSAVVEVEDAAAPVAVSEKALDDVVSQAKAGDIVSIVPATTGSVTVPSTKLAELIEKTGESVTVGNTVATVAVNSALVEAAAGAEVKIAPVKNEDGTISVPIMAGDKEIDPETIEGGVDVEVPVEVTAEQVDKVNAVKADATKVELKWSITVGKLQVNLTVKGSIEIVRK